MKKQRGLIGLFINDNDSQYIEKMLRSLSKALHAVSGHTFDMLVILRSEDTVAQKMCTLFRPASIENLRFLDVSYDLIDVQGGQEPSGEVVCQARNLFREYALGEGYDWLFLLDSGICVQRTTLKLLLAQKEDFVTAIYRWRGYPHPVLIVLSRGETSTNLWRLLINPHLYKTKLPLIPCVGTDVGATLLRRKIFDVPFKLSDNRYILQGGADGFCWGLYERRVQLYALAHHMVHNMIPQRKIPNLPFIDSKLPLLLSLRSIGKGWGKEALTFGQGGVTYSSF